MALTFADTHNMITYLTKSDASEGFEQIIDFLNASSIQKKVIITKDTVQEALHFDDAESIDCLPNEEIFIELTKMGYEKPSTKLTFYKAFFSAQWKFLIHTILQCMSAKGHHGMSLVHLWLRLKVKALEKDKIAQALEITKLKQRVRKLEKKRKLRVSGLKRLRKVRTTQRVKSFADTIMDDQEDASKQGGIIANLYVDKDVTLEEVDAKDAEVEKNADVQGRPEESQAQVYHIDLEHADKVLSMHDDKPKPVDLKEVVEVVTTAKLMTKVVTVVAATITAVTTAASTITVAPSADRRRKGIVIRDPKETATPSTIVHSKPKSRDKVKGIMIEEPKPLKKQAQIEQVEAYARELEAELNKNIKWDDVIEQLEEEESIALKRKTESSKEKAVKKQKLDEEVEELKKHLQIVPNDDDNVYTKATPLALKVSIIDYEIHTEHNKPYYKIKRAGSHQIFLSFLSLLRKFEKEDLEMLWQLVKERFTSSKPKNFSDDFLLTTLKEMFEKPNVQA
uniref:Uncharacterized protein n=1 Tax=Tanacetum cinerariifolium TaxID=118510 RepID=A0A6L2KDV6_TANCI|nr:hypothetical protein [Tanacetum cinerariifolium]